MDVGPGNNLGINPAIVRENVLFSPIIHGFVYRTPLVVEVSNERIEDAAAFVLPRIHLVDPYKQAAEEEKRSRSSTNHNKNNSNDNTNRNSNTSLASLPTDEDGYYLGVYPLRNTKYIIDVRHINRAKAQLTTQQDPKRQFEIASAIGFVMKKQAVRNFDFQVVRAKKKTTPTSSSSSASSPSSPSASSSEATSSSAAPDDFCTKGGSSDFFSIMHTSSASLIPPRVRANC